MAKNSYTGEEKALVKEHIQRVKLSIPLWVLVLAGVAYLLYNDKIDFGQFQSVKSQHLNELGPRIKYVLQHSTPGVLWLLFCFFYVVSKRVGTPAMIPTSGHENRTEVAKNIFLNSLEQFVMLFVSQLILVTHLTAKQALNVIPTLNILFFIGRVLFFLGYPKHRAIGFTLGFVPLVSVIGYIGYRYVKLFSL